MNTLVCTNFVKNCLRFCVVLFLGTTFLSGEAYGQEADFGTLIGEAKTAYDEGNFDVAVEKLLAANRLQPNSRLLLNVARSHAKTGNCSSSAAYYRAFINSSDAESDLVDVATQESDDLECDEFDPEASSRVMFTSTPPGASVKLNGEKLGETPFEAVQLPTGNQSFEFSLEGRETVAVSANPSADKTVTVNADLPEFVAPEPDPEPEPEPIVTEAPPESDDTLKYVAGGIAGLGVAFVVVGLVYDLAIIPSTDEERDKTVVGSPEFQELTDQRSSEASIATISYITGAVLLVGGGSWLTYMILTEPDSSEQDKSDTINRKMGVAPVFGRDSIGIGVFGSF